MAFREKLTTGVAAPNRRGRWHSPARPADDTPSAPPGRGLIEVPALPDRGPVDQTRIAFAFQGGGSLAAPQVGMLWALAEAGIVPDLLVGTSAGALNAVAFATDPTTAGLQSLESLWMSLRRKHVAPFSVRTLVGAMSGRGDGLVSNVALRALLQNGLVAARLENTALPAHVVATELSSGEPVVLSAGDTVPALLATSAFPGLYAPIEIDAHRLVDGGVSADIPVLQAESLGATATFVLPAAASDDTNEMPRGPLSHAYHALGQILDAVARRDLAAARGPLHVLPAPTSRATNPVDFRDTARLIDDGYRLARDWLAGRGSSTGLAASSAPPSRPASPLPVFDTV